MNEKVQARIRRPGGGWLPFVEVKRAKYKHWHTLGKHRESDIAFERSLANGTLEWCPKIFEPPKLF